jgi:hypothetical protein
MTSETQGVLLAEFGFDAEGSPGAKKTHGVLLWVLVKLNRIGAYTREIATHAVIYLNLASMINVAAPSRSTASSK